MDEKLKVWRDTLVKQVVFNDVWYPHPTSNFEGNTQGELRNTASKKLIVGSVSAGRRVLGHATVAGKRMKMQYHRALMECFYNVTIPPQYDIDHKDADPLNNAFDNLQILTKGEHAQKTCDQNPHKGKKAGVKSSYRVVRFRIGENGERVDEMFFDSMNEATRKVKATQKRINRSMEKDVPDSKGYRWANECDNDDLPGEEWRQVPGLRDGMFVSNKGRVWYTYRPNPYKTFGSKTAGGYFTFSCDGPAIKVHRAVILAFTGTSPTDDHTVDHIDQNTGNNCIENLRWATPSDQAKNRKCMRRIEVYDTTNPGIALKTFDTETEVAAEYSTTQTAVSEVVRFRINGYVRTRSSGKPRVSQHIKRGTTLSARYADMTSEEKLSRELSFFDYQVEIAKKDKGKRKSNPENLPIGVIRNSQGGLSMTIKFLGKKYPKCGGKDPAALARLRDEWFNKEVENHKMFIRQSFDNDAPQSATLPNITE
jgi:hypothetical protein